MAIRQILVPLVGADDAKRLLENAFTIARQHSAHVTVYDTSPWFLPAIDPSGMTLPSAYPELIKKLEAQQEQVHKASHAQFENVAKVFGISVKDVALPDKATACWVDGREYKSSVWGLGRLVDLVITHRPVGAGIPDQEIIEEALFGARRPVLMFPSKGVHLERGGAIAWNGSVEACTALERAIDLLDRDKPVVVIQVGDLRPGALAATAAVAYLESHGFKARTQFVPDAPKETAATILRVATELQAGILVAGAYSHSRVREALFGGVTATLLKSAHMPVLLVH